LSYVYVITNEFMPGISKLGATSDITRRFGELQNVLPGKSTLRWSMAVDNCFRVEAIIRDQLRIFAIEKSHDWFACNHKVLINQFERHLEGELGNQFTKHIAMKHSIVADRLRPIGRMVREKRRKQGMRLKEMAGLCGVGVRFLSELERGKSTCQFDLTIHVINTAGIDIMAVCRDVKQ